MFSSMTLAPTQCSLPLCFKLYCLTCLAWTVKMLTVAEFWIFSGSHQISFMQARIFSRVGGGGSASFSPWCCCLVRGWMAHFKPNIFHRVFYLLRPAEHLWKGNGIKAVLPVFLFVFAGFEEVGSAWVLFLNQTITLRWYAYVIWWFTPVSLKRVALSQLQHSGPRMKWLDIWINSKQKVICLILSSYIPITTTDQNDPRRTIPTW